MAEPDERLYELWKNGSVRSAQLSVSERERLNLMAIREGMAESLAMVEAAKPRKKSVDAA